MSSLLLRGCPRPHVMLCCGKTLAPPTSSIYHLRIGSDPTAQVIPLCVLEAPPAWHPHPSCWTAKRFFQSPRCSTKLFKRHLRG